MKKNHTHPFLEYDPTQLPRELKPYYISATDSDINEMLKALSKRSLQDLYNHIPQDLYPDKTATSFETLTYEETLAELLEISEKNQIFTSFLGDHLQNYKVHPVVKAVSNIRNLSTAYTPYQAERSQGTLISFWIFQCLISQLTGFEAINISLYERATALFEALTTAVRITNKNKVIICESILPHDKEVVFTLAKETSLDVYIAPLNEKTGSTDFTKLDELIHTHKDSLAALAFPQINTFGILEDVDKLTDICQENEIKSIAIIDPALLATEGLKPPSDYGKNGADIMIGEAQHLAIAPNFGGPGLGIFGIRFNDENRTAIRSIPGRLVGKAKDATGKECFISVLSTREQHIRQDKATSNICSNQAFISTLVGASLLAKGEVGLQTSCKTGFENAQNTIKELINLKGIALAFPDSPFYNECVLELDRSPTELIQQGLADKLHVGINVSDRALNRNLLKVSFNDTQTPEDCQTLIRFFKKHFQETPTDTKLKPIPEELKRTDKLQLLSLPSDTVIEYYNNLGELNISPDNSIYPLGSCTMKYNPYINDWAANLKGFTQAHPQAPYESTQGCLEILYKIQEHFKSITGLSAVTTQPLAGAQGELVGIKMIQAYHRDKEEAHRNIVFIPESAHGTNFATASTAGFITKKINDQIVGIIRLKSNSNGQIDYNDFKSKLNLYGDRLSCVMITNPNTCGIFETQFKQIADDAHASGALVYLDGANMNAIAGNIDLKKLGVDAVHNNLHKTWSIPHGGGGPGDAIVAVSDLLVDYLPGFVIKKNNNTFAPVKAKKSIGSFHRNWGNFAHKVRCYTYLSRLGTQGIKKMSAVAILASQYVLHKLKDQYPVLPKGTENITKLHEFIITLPAEVFEKIEALGIPKSLIITRVGKLFLDFGIHTPTIAWPETYGLMIEPTEIYSKKELDRFIEIVIEIGNLIKTNPEVLLTTPHFTPINQVDEVSANRNLIISEKLTTLPTLFENKLHPEKIAKMTIKDISNLILTKHKQIKS